MRILIKRTYLSHTLHHSQINCYDKYTHYTNKTISHVPIRPNQSSRSEQCSLCPGTWSLIDLGPIDWHNSSHRRRRASMRGCSKCSDRRSRGWCGSTDHRCRWSTDPRSCQVLEPGAAIKFAVYSVNEERIGAASRCLHRFHNNQSNHGLVVAGHRRIC